MCCRTHIGNGFSRRLHKETSFKAVSKEGRTLNHDHLGVHAQARVLGVDMYKCESAAWVQRGRALSHMGCWDPWVGQLHASPTGHDFQHQVLSQVWQALPQLHCLAACFRQVCSQGGATQQVICQWLRNELPVHEYYSVVRTLWEKISPRE